jgi:hypothetical protein
LDCGCNYAASVPPAHRPTLRHLARAAAIFGPASDPFGGSKGQGATITGNSTSTMPEVIRAVCPHDCPDTCSIFRLKRSNSAARSSSTPRSTLGGAVSRARRVRNPSSTRDSESGSCGRRSSRPRLPRYS